VERESGRSKRSIDVERESGRLSQASMYREHLERFEARQPLRAPGP
jgi:hypothetical protein